MDSAKAQAILDAAKMSMGKSFDNFMVWYFLR